MTPLTEILLRETGLPETDLVRLIETAPRRYKVYQIPKRNGGMREIAQPAREVKFLQRVIIDRILKDLPVHEAAFAYRKGLSIKENADQHCGSGPILKMDFTDFFPSIRAIDWANYCKTKNLMSDDDILSSSRILFRRIKTERILKLSIGAPSSPMLCNILLYEFDSFVATEALRKGIKYSRYADDMTFSGQRIGMLKDIPRLVSKAIRDVHCPKLTVNEIKTKYITAAHRRVVTGVTLSNNGSTGVGREKKRTISAQVHNALFEKLSHQELCDLAGQLAFINSVEPSFIARLVDWYGSEILRQIRRSSARS